MGMLLDRQGSLTVDSISIPIMLKRKASADNAALAPVSKRQNISVDPTNAPTLCSLPGEVKDKILDHLIPSPSHIQYATFPANFFREVFVQGILGTNQAWRQNAIARINWRCLWIKLTATDEAGASFLEDIRTVVPQVPPLFHCLVDVSATSLSANLVCNIDPGTGKSREHPVKAGPENTVIMPYNFHSFLQLCSCLNKDYMPAWDLNYHSTLTIEPHIDSVRFKSLVNFQIIPVLELFATTRHVKATLNDYTSSFDISKFGRPDPSYSNKQIGDRILRLVETIVEMDKRGYRLEADLLCAYQGFEYCDAGNDTTVGTVGTWLRRSDGLRSANARDNALNLRRMQIVRSVCYIATRGCIGYLAGNAHHVPAFEDRHFLDATHYADWACLNDVDCHYLGVPDHERAQWHYAQSLIIFQYEYPVGGSSKAWNFSFLVPSFWQSSTFRILQSAWLAWALDADNVVYGRHLRHLLTNIPYTNALIALYTGTSVEDLWMTPVGEHDNIPERHHWLWSIIVQLNATITRMLPGTDGQSFFLLADRLSAQNWSTSMGGDESYHQLAFDIGRSARVAYDTREAYQLPPPCDQMQYRQRMAALVGTNAYRTEIGPLGDGASLNLDAISSSASAGCIDLATYDAWSTWRPPT